MNITENKKKMMHAKRASSKIRAKTKYNIKREQWSGAKYHGN